MIKSFSMYPHEINDEYIKKIDTTLELAYRYGFDEVFTSIHLPEYSLLQQLECLDIIAARAEKYHFDITVDIGGHYIPDDDVRRPYTRSKRNFWHLYAPIVDYWTLLYNGDAQVTMVARKNNGNGIAIFSESLLELFKEGL